jgi:hypothetical protein
MKIRQIFILLTASICFVHGYAIGMQDEGQEGKKGLFCSDTLLEMEFHLPWDSLLADTGENPGYHDGILVYYDSTGVRKEIMVEVRTRGHFRKDPANCDFPPLKLKFSRKEVAGTVFEGLKDIKMVTHCQDDVRDYEQYVLQEYLIYRIYNIYTPLSFAVRLARMHYIDFSGTRDTLTRFAFFLENPEDLASRNHGELLEFSSAPSDKLDQDQLALMALFNYMIINTDYSVPIMHNVVLVSRNYFEPPLPVPYDFDWSGLIDIPYDSPYTAYKKDSPERIYKGPCLKMKKLEEILYEMESKRHQVFSLFVEFPYLDNEKKARNIQDLYLFYIMAGNRKLIREAFIRGCPGK